MCGKVLHAPCVLDSVTGYAVPCSIIGGKLADNDGPDSVNILPALVGRPDKPVRDHVVLAPQRPQNLAIRQGRWIYIGAPGGGGFQGTKPGDHALGGPAALKFTGEVNSDIEDGRIKPDAPAAQLYDLADDPSQTRNVIREHPDIVGQLRQRLDACGVKTASPEPQERAKKGRR